MPYRDVAGLAENSALQRDAFSRREAISRYFCYANILDAGQIDGLVANWQASGRIRQASIETGGHWPDRRAWFSTYASGGMAQFTPPPAVMQSIHAYLDENGIERPAYPPKVNMSHVLWRWTHGYRMLPVGCEVSHHGEAYESADHWPANQLGVPYSPGFRCEVTQLEDGAVNESRKLCSRFALMWRRPDGVLIPQDQKDTYNGPTMCIHGALFDTPCYGPFPTSGEAIKRVSGAARRKVPTSGEQKTAPKPKAGGRPAKKSKIEA
jgi:hypothetical protein